MREVGPIIWPNHLEFDEFSLLNLGGTAGCIIASRISDADPNLSVLVVEKGRNNYDERLIRHPAYFFSNLAPDGGAVTYYVGNKSENLAGRQIAFPTASILGGGSSVNMVIYSRAQRSDYDSWQMPGWSANDLLPYMKKVVPLPMLPSSDAKHHSSKHTMGLLVPRICTAMTARFPYPVDHIGFPGSKTTS